MEYSFATEEEIVKKRKVRLYCICGQTEIFQNLGGGGQWYEGVEAV